VGGELLIGATAAAEADRRTPGEAAMQGDPGLDSTSSIAFKYLNYHKY
jgi:hypothetical protein